MILKILREQYINYTILNSALYRIGLREQYINYTILNSALYRIKGKTPAKKKKTQNARFWITKRRILIDRTRNTLSLDSWFFFSISSVIYFNLYFLIYLIDRTRTTRWVCSCTCTICSHSTALMPMYSDNAHCTKLDTW